jgi:predicted dehydrogenase
MGIYNVAMSQFVMGRDPASILADGIVGETGVDERSSGLLNYGGPVSMFTSNFQAQTANDMTISGTKGSIVIDAEFWAAKKATLTIHGGETTVIEKPFRASGFEYQIEEAMSCIRAGKLQSDVIPWKDTLGNMRTMDQMLTQIGVEYPFCRR